MICLLCDHEGATAVNEEIVIWMSCEPCGGAYAITWSAADAWLMGKGSAKTVALELARKHLANLRRFVPAPRILAEDVRAWVKAPA